MGKKVLFVDDEAITLEVIGELFADLQVPFLTASNGAEALAHFERGEEIAVVVSDFKMPGMRGIDLLAKVQELSPATVRILMTAHADLASAIDPAQMGKLYRFLIKPWENKTFVNTVLEALDHARLIHSLSRYDEPSMLSLAQAIELKDPYTHGHCSGVAVYVQIMAESLALDEKVQRLMKYGSWLHDCGKIAIPDPVLTKQGAPDEGELRLIRLHPYWGAELARQAQLDEIIVNMILCHHERFDGKGYPAGSSGDAIPLEARIMAIADSFDALTTDRPYRKRFSVPKAKEMLAAMGGAELDPELVDIFLANFRTVREQFFTL